MLQKTLNVLARIPFSVGCVLLVGAAYGLRVALVQSQRDSALAWWALGVAFALCLCAKTDLRAHLPTKAPAKILGWVLLASSFALIIFDLSAASYWMAGVGAAVFFGGVAVFWSSLGAFLLWCVALPSMDYLHFVVSFPMRMVAAYVSAGVLNLFGMAASATDTSVMIDGREIAVTAACSGIEQLEALLLFAFVAAFFMQKRWLWRWLHTLLVLPLILLFNAVRLCVTLAGTQWFGDVFLSDTMHSSLGLATVLLICGSFLWIGARFPDREEGKR